MSSPAARIDDRIHPTRQALRSPAEWLSAPEAYAVMKPATYQELLAGGLPMRELDRDARRVVVAR